MTTLINTFLATGRDILAAERQLAGLPVDDPHHPRLSAEHTRLMRRQQDEIVAAHAAGVDWATITFALGMHGQGADREFANPGPTPAEQLLTLIRAHGAEVVVAALDAARTAGAGQ